jgi:D-amino-acid oxidase
VADVNKGYRLQAQALAKNITLIRRHYPSIASLLSAIPATDLLIICTGIGALHLSDIKDTNLYPTRGQTLLVAEPKTPIQKMYEYERHYKYDGVLFCRTQIEMDEAY